VSQSEPGISTIGGISDAQRSHSRALVEQAGPPSPIDQHRGTTAPQVAEQARAWSGADTVKMSEEALQAVHGRAVPEIESVTALKAALESMIHERTQNQGSGSTDLSRDDEPPVAPPPAAENRAPGAEEPVVVPAPAREAAA
jgi:hypothetical protein